MQLIKVRLHSYKRFAEKSTMTVDGKVIAIVGPNEAGKSSFLQALGHLNHNQDFNVQEGSRELNRKEEPANDQKIVWTLFRLDQIEKEDIRKRYCERVDLESNAQSVEVWKTVDGKRVCRLSEPLPRDTDIRSNLESALSIEASDIQELSKLSQEQKTQLTQNCDELLASLRSKKVKEYENFASELNHTKQIRERLQPHASKELLEALKQYTSNETAIQQFEDQIQRELLQRVPKILLFDNENRQLKSRYEVAKIMTQGKTILNLIELAGVNPQELVQHVKNSYTSEIETWQEQANARLTEIFNNIWSQSGITVRFRVSGNNLHIIVGNRDGGYSTVAERSDGLKFYIALAAFIGVNRKVKPILLIDEAEMHLHYDAQADLTQMFYEQDVAAKIIYTTHSAGCLPEDLGTSVRIVKPEGEYTSSIQNQLWEGNTKGFRPLLLAMGAGTLAFNSVRYGLFVEGITDCLLLPTLLKEVMETDYLGFQVLPGLSRIPKGTSLELELEAKRMAYLVDGDEGGRTIRDQLIEEKIPETKVFSLPEDVVLENLISQEIYDDAVIKSADKSQKEEVVQRILEQRYKDKTIVAEKHREYLRKLYEDIVNVLEIPKTNS